MGPKIYAHGNCQVYFMHKLLREKHSDLDVSFGEVHKLDLQRDMDQYESDIRNADFIISQNVSGQYRGEKRFSLD